jgi:hypothetical protein
MAATELEQRRQIRQIRIAAEEVERRHLTVENVHRRTPNLDGPQRLATFEALPESDQAEIWRQVGIRSHDRRYAEGVADFTPVRRPKAPKPRPAQRRASTATADLGSVLDSLRALPAEDYLVAIAGVEPLPGGRVQCPYPSHEDRNPSCTYTGSVGYCHTCGRGFDLISLSSEVSGIGTTGRDFIELIRWIGDRLRGYAGEIEQALERRAA